MRLDEQAADEDEDQYQEDDEDRFLGEAEHGLRDGLRRLLEDDGIADHAGQEDDQRDHADVLDALGQRLLQARPGQFAMDEGADDDGVDDGEGADLGGGEDAGADADQERDREDQRPFGAPQRLRHLRPGRPLLADDAVALLLGEEPDGRHQRDHHDEAGDDAGEKQPADRDVSDEAVEDEAEARRDRRGDQRADGDGRGGEALRIAACDHAGAEDARFHRRVGDGRAGHAAHEGREQDADLREAARHPGDQRVGTVDQPLGDAGLVHHMAGEDEERHGEERKALRGRGDLLDADRDRDEMAREEEGEARNADGEGDRHAGQHQREEDDGEEQHGLRAPAARRSARRRNRARRRACRTEARARSGRGG